jgi:hypothetical protein
MGRTRQGRQVYLDGDLQTVNRQEVQLQFTEARTWSINSDQLVSILV